MRKGWKYGAAITGLLLCTAVAGYAQDGSSKFIRQGNAQFRKQQYADAEANYKKALERNGKSTTGHFNLGNSLYLQKRFDAAREQYATSAKSTGDKTVRADAAYNTGNTFMEDKKWQESVQAYKAALKNNPNDEQARYNLAYAQAMLKKQQENESKDNKDNKDNKDKKNKDKQQQQQDEKDKKDQQDKKDKQDQQDKQDKEQQQQPQPKPSKLSQDEAKRLLQNLAQQEKKLQEDKMKKVKGTPGAVEKDW
ncbi:tetratricopeptide repeat protein [Chitinophaga lutea]